jgi:hypothetical protein
MPDHNQLRKRGRPRKHADPEQKKAVHAEQKRAKRRKEMHEKRELVHDQFYSMGGNSRFPILPPPLAQPDVSPSRTGQNDGISPGIAGNPEDDITLPDDLSSCLPPLSPPLEPITEAIPDLVETTMLAREFSPSDNSDHPANIPLDDDPIAVTSEHRETHETLHPAEADYSDHTHQLARRLTDQLSQFYGCCADCHQAAEAEHHEQFEKHTSLKEYLDEVNGICPDILGSTRIASHGDNLPHQTNASGRRQIYTGLTAEAEDCNPPHICLSTDERRPDFAGISFDIDSVTGFPTSIAVAKQGIRWKPTQMPVSDLQSGLHLRPRAVHFFDESGRSHTVYRPIHQIPHYTFGRLVGFEDVTLYLLFPHLYRKNQQSSRLRDHDFRLWMDEVLLPILYQQNSSAHVQHYPSSYDHSRYNATARGIETLSQRVDPVAREQQLSYYIPPDCLVPVWDQILVAVQEPRYHHFRDVTILLQVKNLKVLTKDVTWELMIQRFQGYWSSAIHSRFTGPDFYFDIGKEVCPRQSSLAGSCATESRVLHEAATNRVDGGNLLPAEVLLWKRCCLESYGSFMQDGWMKDRTRKEIFYPFSMLHDTGSLTIESSPQSPSRAAGLLYTQLYPSVKEVFAAGNIYPFTNTAIETLALDKKLRRTWELVGGGLSHNPAAVMKAYMYTKLRCHFALQGSTQKSFGVREEYRVSRSLFDAIDSDFRLRQLHQEHLTTSTRENCPYYTFTTATLLRWLRWNINKFCVGFETVYSSQDAHFVTWEHTRIMLMFLRCLQFSYSGGLIQKVGGCWQDVRLQPDSRQPNGLRRIEGLGFRRTMEEYGYAWFLDKVDWMTLTFRQPHSAHMLFNSPSMQAAYHAKYRQIRDVRVDFIRVDKARQWMIEFSAVPSCLDVLGKYLRQLCLCTFRKDVFAHIQSELHPDCVEAALAGQIPLCYESIQQVMKEEGQELPLAHGPRVAVKNVDVLFAWLWEWKDGQFGRQGWDEKPYRMLFRRSFEAITIVRGKASARTWRQDLKTSFLRSHWMLPYPQRQAFMRKDKQTKRFVWWPSFHDGLNRYYRQLGRYSTAKHPFPASHIKHHPSSGWRLAPGESSREYMDYTVQPEQRLMYLSEDEFYQDLVHLRDHFRSHPSVVPMTHPPVQEYNIQSTGYTGASSMWSMKKRGWVQRTVEDCRTASECGMFLREALEKYEILQHSSRNLRQRKKPPTCYAQFDTDSDTDSRSSQSSGDTSDEDSVVGLRRRQAVEVRRLEQIFRSHMNRERKETARPKLYFDLEENFNHRLQQVEE